MTDLISTAKTRTTIWTYKVYRKYGLNPFFIQSRLYADEIMIRWDAELVHVVDSHTPNETRRKDK